jgi:hypothetical protein
MLGVAAGSALGTGGGIPLRIETTRILLLLRLSHHLGDQRVLHGHRIHD